MSRDGRTRGRGRLDRDGAHKRSRAVTGSLATLPRTGDNAPDSRPGGPENGDDTGNAHRPHCWRCEQFGALASSEIVGVISGEGQRIYRANDTFLAMVGRPRDELDGGLDWLEMTPPEHRDRDVQGMAVLQSGERFPVIEKEFTRPDGIRVPVLIGGVMIHPEPYRWVAVVVDLTERKRLERQLAEIEQRAVHARLDATASTIHRLQESLLPSELPKVDGVELLVQYLAVADDPVGGDWYNGFVTLRGRLALTIGDVAGHGLDATRAMGELRSATLMAGLIEHDATAVLGHVHRFARHLLPGVFATALLTLYEPTTGGLSWARAGHLPPLMVRRRGDAAYLEGEPGRPLGIGEGYTPFHESHLDPGDTLVLFTDGLVERRDESITDGLERLRAALAEVATDRIALRDLWEAGRTACLPDGVTNDDVCMVLLRRIE